MALTTLFAIPGRDIRTTINWFDFQRPGNSGVRPMRELIEDRFHLHTLYDITELAGRDRFEMTCRDSEASPAIFRLTGVVDSFKVPGLRRVVDLTRLDSGVTISGHYTRTFDESSQVVDYLHQFFLDALDTQGQEVLNTVRPRPGGYEGRCLFARGYQLTHVSQASNGEHIQFSRSEDPHSLLKNWVTHEGDYVRLDNGIVQHLDGRPEAALKGQARPVTPRAIRIGDIVDINVLPVVQKTIDDGYHFMWELKSIEVRHRFVTIEHIYRPLKSPAYKSELSSAEYSRVSRFLF